MLVTSDANGSLPQ